MRSPAVFLALSLLAAASPAQTTVHDIRRLLVEAIDSPDGASHGTLQGDAAQVITRHFGAASTIVVDVRTERRLAQPGCSRLNLVLRQDGVLLPGAAAPRQQTIAFGLDYCRDGSSPRPPK